MVRAQSGGVQRRISMPLVVGGVKTGPIYRGRHGGKFFRLAETF